jgi:hypothetical protein
MAEQRTLNPQVQGSNPWGGTSERPAQRSPGVGELIVHVGRDPLTGKPRYRSRTEYRRLIEKRIRPDLGDVTLAKLTTAPHSPGRERSRDAVVSRRGSPCGKTFARTTPIQIDDAACTR